MNRKPFILLSARFSFQIYFVFAANGVQNLFCFLRDFREKTGIPFNLHNDYISELVTYGILKAGEDGFCEIANPIYRVALCKLAAYKWIETTISARRHRCRFFRLFNF